MTHHQMAHHQMAQPLVIQLRFARSELQRALNGLTDEDSRHRIQPMNCISWMIGHLADQEHRYWVQLAQNKTIAPDLNNLVGFGKPATTPALADMWEVWNTVTIAADSYLDALTVDDLQRHFVRDGTPASESIGTMLQRTLYHYWYHIGEAMAVRQLLGHAELPEFVGKLGLEGPYRPEF